MGIASVISVTKNTVLIRMEIAYELRQPTSARTHTRASSIIFYPLCGLMPRSFIPVSSICRSFPLTVGLHINTAFLCKAVLFVVFCSLCEICLTISFYFPLIFFSVSVSTGVRLSNFPKPYSEDFCTNVF